MHVHRNGGRSIDRLSRLILCICHESFGKVGEQRQRSYIRLMKRIEKIADKDRPSAIVTLAAEVVGR